jgi:glycosyltransferase involved in cell wall biosynthesis
MMKVLHMISGGETGGSRKHLITLLNQFPSAEVTLAVLQEGALSEEAREAGIRVEVFKQSSRYDLSILKKLTQFIKQESFDILHTHGPRSNLFGIYLKKKTKILWATTIHSDPSLDFVKGGLKGGIFTSLHMYAVKKMNLYFAVSERFKENLVKLGIDRKKIQTVYNGVDFTSTRSQATSRERIGVRDEDFVMTMVARLHPIKRHDMVLEALKKIGNPRVHLLLVGDGPLKEELEHKTHELNLDSKVHFLGFRQDVDQIYAASNLALLASDSESFPLALLEAANQHVPILTTDVGGVNELVQLDKTGWIVPPGDQTRYQKSIEEAYALFESGELSSMGTKLYEYASRHFSLHQLYLATKMGYSNLIENK